MENFTCSCCNSFKSLTLRTSLNDYFIVHRDKPNFQVTFNVDGCPATLKKYNSFYKHVHKQHRVIYDQQRQDAQEGTATCKRQLDRRNDDNGGNNDVNEQHNDVDMDDSDRDIDENYQAANQVFKFYILHLIDIY